jgi:hypothetical protein
MKNNKKVYLLALIVIACTSVVLQGGIKKEIKSSLKQTPTPTPIVTESVEDSIKNLLVEKYGWNKDTIILTVKNNENGYASGDVKMTGETGGGLWFAAKIDNQWKLVSDGNGMTTCGQLKDYPNFPKTILPQCLDEKTNKLVKR